MQTGSARAHLPCPSLDYPGSYKIFAADFELKLRRLPIPDVLDMEA